MSFLRSHFRVLRTGSILAATVIATYVVARIIVASTDASLRADYQAQYLSLLESCTRLNILRVEDNISHLADYRVFRIVLIESQTLPERPGTTRGERHFERLFLHQLKAAVRAKAWTAPTDCTQAVNRQGVRYKPSAPIPFYRQLPPRSALALPQLTP